MTTDVELRDEVGSIYDDWYESNRQEIAAGRWKLLEEKVLRMPQEDPYRGLNLITYLSDDVNEAIESLLLPRLAEVIPHSWVVPTEGRHVTILDIIPHNALPHDAQQAGGGERNWRGFAQPFVNILQDMFSSEVMPELRVEFRGVFASPDGITIQGFPKGDGLFSLRKMLRDRLTAAGLPNLERSKYVHRTFHSALIKFIAPPDWIKLLKIVDENRGLDLGEFTVKNLVLNVSSRYDKVKTIQVIEHFTL